MLSSLALLVCYTGSCIGLASPELAIHLSWIGEKDILALKREVLSSWTTEVSWCSWENHGDVVWNSGGHTNERNCQILSPWARPTTFLVILLLLVLQQSGLLLHWIWILIIWAGMVFFYFCCILKMIFKRPREGRKYYFLYAPVGLAELIVSEIVFASQWKILFADDISNCEAFMRENPDQISLWLR